MRAVEWCISRLMFGCLTVGSAVLVAGCSVPVELSGPGPVAGTAVPTAVDEPDAPVLEVSDRWPEAVRDYVAFVQATRGEEFRIVADVRFVDPDAVIEEFQSDLTTLDELAVAEQEIVLKVDDMYRALGLSNDEFNLLEANRDVVDDIAAFYDWQSGEIVFPSPGGEPLDEIPILDRPVLVHELAHALQIHSRVSWTENLEDRALGLALLEGEAEWLLDRYLWSLSDEEWLAWHAALPARAPDPQTGILEAEFATSYVLGSRFFHARFTEAGLDGIDDVFDGRGRVTAQMLVDPWRFSGREVRQETFGYEPPVPPVVAQVLELGTEFPTTAVMWHQILGAALAGPEALRAARAINSLTYPAAWIDADDRLCFAVKVAASIGREGLVEDALQRWSQVAGVDRWVEPIERGFEVGGCDPGPGNVPDPRATPVDVLGEAAVVIDAEVWARGRGLDPATGFCLGWRVIDELEADPALDMFAWLGSVDVDATSSDC